MIVKHKKNAKKERKSLEIKIKCVILQPNYKQNDKMKQIMNAFAWWWRSRLD